MSTGKTKKQAGFTLVEIAIVLVIIGLLLGGILKGQEMITQARIKNIVNDFNGVTAAYFAYQDRYKAIPGDDSNAPTRWAGPNAPAASGTAGNGTIEGTYNSATAGDESRLFWHHLRLAGFVPGATAAPQATQQPNNAVGGFVGVENSPFALTGLAICSANIPDKIAIAADTQLDDQNPNTGAMRGRQQTAANQATAATTAISNYQETGSNQYLICRSI